MLKIGLTGGIGSGKTTISNLFAQLNESENLVSIIDTDIVAREIVAVATPTYNAIVDSFGGSILNADLTINRSTLRKIIFSDSKSKRQLESLTHPAIQATVFNKISKLSSKYCIIVIPLLFETQSDYKLDRVLVVDSEKEQQIERTRQRDLALPEDVELIIKSQVSREYRLKHADDVIINNRSQQSLLPQVEKLHHLYLKLANAPK